MSEKAAQAEAKLDQPVAPVDNVSNQSSQIWSTSLESWNQSEKQMSPWKDADVGKDGFASSNKLLGDINNKGQSTKDGNTLDMSVPIDGAQTLDGQPNKNKAQNGVEALDGAQTKDGQPNKNKAQNGVESLDGAQTKEGEPNKNKAQNGVEAVDGAQTKEGEPNKNKAQNGVEEQKKSPEDQKKDDDQRKAEEQKLLEGAMFDKNLSSEQKLSAAQELLKRGVTNVSGVDEAGKNASLRLESEPAGGREMVHVFSSKEGGNEKTALRGIANADGSWEQERNSRGKQVSFEGKGAADLASMSKEGSVPDKPSEPRAEEQIDPAKPRKEGEAPRQEGDAPRKEGEAPHKEGEAPRQAGEASGKEGEVPRQKGEVPRVEGEPPQKEGTEKKVEGNESPEADKMAELHKMFDEAGKQAKGKVGKLVSTDQGVYVKSNFDVDVDGSPRAKQIDPDGRPDTSMQYKNGRYVNAEEVPFMVLPKDQFKKHGLKIGDMGLVRDTGTGNIAAAVFADAGPRGKTGEGSINLGKEGLGLKELTPTNGIDANRFEYLAMPKTNQGTPKNQAELLQRIDDFKRQMGLIK